MSPVAPDTGPYETTERLARLRLIRSENVGPVTFEALIARFGSGRAALEALPDLARKGGRTGPIRICDATAAEREMAEAERLDVHLLMTGEPAYPARLAAIDAPPPVLYARGRVDLLDRPAMAMVGARNASALGQQFAEMLARDLGAQGLVIVSGLARGIDGSAHRGALATGTVAVFAGGIDYIYPPEHRELAEAIADQGVLMSEMPLGFSPQARHFPRRNRLVSGLSLGVVVVEAAIKSGSLITARHALDQGRDVFAVPGSPLDPRARGGNRLLRQGAILTETADDVMEAVAPLIDAPIRPLAETPLPSLRPMAEDPSDDDMKAVRTALWPLLGPTPTAVDLLVRKAGVPTDLALVALMEWDLAGRIRREAGGQVAAAPVSA